MRPLAILLLSSLPLLSACNNLSTSGANPATDKAAPTGDTRTGPTQRMRGTLENGGSQLQLCTGGKPLALDTSADPDLMARLLASQLSGDSRSQLIDLSGHMARAEGDDEPRLVAEQIYRLETGGKGCKDEDYGRMIVSAAGNAPDWSVRVLQRGLLLEQAGKPARVLPYVEEKMPDGSLSFSSEANNERIELWLASGRCKDSKDNLYHLQATLRLNADKPLTGCGALGGARQ